MKETISNYFRKRRFGFFTNFMNQASPNDGPLRILDIGGTQQYWLNMGMVLTPQTEIVLLNLYINEVSVPGFSSIVGDACNLSGINDQSFDIVFSNSVIEQQEKMANEVARVGKSYFIQTPNKYFPIEPHWLFPLFQFLPFTVQVFLTQHFTLGNIKKTKSKEAAINLVKEVKLLSIKEFASFFKDAKIYKEKILGVTKSFTAYKIANHN
jgi:hypothetical protein